MIKRHEEEAKLIIIRDREMSCSSSMQSTRSIKRNFKSIDEINDYTWNLFKNSKDGKLFDRAWESNEEGASKHKSPSQKRELAQWSQVIKTESRLHHTLEDVGADATDLDELMLRIENSHKSSSLEIMHFAFEKIK